MIIDTHVHLTVPGFTKGKFLISNARLASHLYNRIHKTNITPDDYIAMLKGRADPDCSKLLAAMDQAGIDKSIIFGVDWAYGRTGEPRINNREQNRIHAEMARKYPDRFVALAALDPRRPDVIEQANQAIEEWGMKGFKLHPSAGFYPNDPVCFPLYEKCAQWGVPIVFHSGGGEGNWVCGQPMYIATAAENFHDVKMVMAHAGWESWRQAMYAAAMLPNLYLDISVWGQWEYCMRPSRFYGRLREMIDETTPEKVLFASDAPLPVSWISMEEWVKAVKEPQTDITFTKEELELVLGKAAMRVFDI
jgi:predicted TIM-barrel fold metal-dependent hydrolase